jgi:hypothetical protein
MPIPSDPKIQIKLNFLFLYIIGIINKNIMTMQKNGRKKIKIKLENIIKNIIKKDMTMI